METTQPLTQRTGFRRTMLALFAGALGTIPGALIGGFTGVSIAEAADPRDPWAGLAYGVVGAFFGALIGAMTVGIVALRARGVRGEAVVGYGILATLGGPVVAVMLGGFWPLTLPTLLFLAGRWFFMRARRRRLAREASALPA